MDAKSIFEALKAKFGDAVIELQEGTFRPEFVVVASKSVADVARFLRDDAKLKFDSLMCLSGIDYKDRFAVAYHLHSVSLGHVIGLKAYVSKDDPALPTVDAVWPGANFMERETYDLFGIVFQGSMDLERILLPPDWEGHPLRKDYQYAESYHGIKI